MTRLPQPDPRPSRPGFTITELLIVVAIIVTLASIGLMVGRSAFASADNTRLRAQLQTIEKALEAYKSDFGSYPLTSVDDPATNVDDKLNAEGLRGARTLCKALVAPTPGLNLNNAARNVSYEDQDGKSGLGFRVVGRSGVARYKGVAIADDELQGPDYGPYVQGSAIKWSKTDAAGALVGGEDFDDTTVLLDANGYAILYYPVLNSQPNLAALNAYVGPGPTPTNRTTILPMYRTTDNTTWIPQELLRTMLGDRNNDGAINLTLNQGETAVIKGQPLLITPGRDGLFGPNPSVKQKEKANDDVTNFAD